MLSFLSIYGQLDSECICINGECILYHTKLLNIHIYLLCFTENIQMLNWAELSEIAYNSWMESQPNQN